jgi:hypothetical protein
MQCTTAALRCHQQQRYQQQQHTSHNVSAKSHYLTLLLLGEAPLLRSPVLSTSGCNKQLPSSKLSTSAAAAALLLLALLPVALPLLLLLLGAAAAAASTGGMSSTSGSASPSSLV